MLIDIQTHIINRNDSPDGVKWGLVRKMARSTLPFGDPKGFKDLVPHVDDALHDPEGEKWVKDMEYFGIDVGVCQTNDFGAAEGWSEEAPLSCIRSALPRFPPQ